LPQFQAPEAQRSEHAEKVTASKGLMALRQNLENNNVMLGF
jgi:hypothetical protein